MPSKRRPSLPATRERSMTIASSSWATSSPTAISCTRTFPSIGTPRPCTPSASRKSVDSIRDGNASRATAESSTVICAPVSSTNAYGPCPSSVASTQSMPLQELDTEIGTAGRHVQSRRVGGEAPRPAPGQQPDGDDQVRLDGSSDPVEVMLHGSHPRIGLRRRSIARCAANAPRRTAGRPWA